MIATPGQTIKLGLIGDNISRSKSPLLHRTAGRMAGLDVTYDRLIPRDLGLSFEETFAQAQSTGYRGINVTYPYKEVAARMVTIPDAKVGAIGAVNTVVFNASGPEGHNTDYSGFKRAYRGVRGQTPPGKVCLIGAGGVGKAIAFALVDLGAEMLCIADLDLAKADGLARSLQPFANETRLLTGTDPVAMAQGAQGIVNCTPLGMVGIGGTPLPAQAMAGAAWCFDAVYTPVETTFLQDAGGAGLQIISGYELFFGQGVDAWQIFTGAPVDQPALRRVIADEPS